MTAATEMRKSEKLSWLRDTALLIRLIFTTSPIRGTVVVVLNALENASQALFAVFLGWIVDAGVRGDLDAIVTAGAVIAAILGLSLMAGVGGFYIRLNLADRVGHRIDRDVLEITAGLPRIEHQERPEFLDDLNLLREQREVVGHSVGAMVTTIGVLVQLGVSVVLLARVHSLLVFLPLFGIPSLAFAAKAQSWVYGAMRESQPFRRKADLLYGLATSPGPAKELRIFGTVDDISRRHDEGMHESERLLWGARIRATILTSIGWTVFAVGYALALLLVIDGAAKGQITPGKVLMVLTLAGQLNGQVSGVANVVAWLLQTLKTIGRYRWLRTYAGRQEPSGTETDLPKVLTDGIRFEGVSFAYPGTDRPILTDVTMHLPAGARVAVVGDNGAGKSTLMKLLCGFYDPTSGRIMVDDRPLSSFDPQAWRDRLSAGFQDFARYDLEAGEVVGIGQLRELGNTAAYDAALDRAGAEEVIPGLKARYATPLGRSFEDGIELSGGQWQKLALGRAMMRPNPLLLVLDEPTAALDADTEHRLFTRYAEAAARAAQETGAITVFVSHRFSTVRMADIIIVVDGGRIVESGSHSQLLAKNGLYSELYEIQARQYR